MKKTVFSIICTAAIIAAMGIAGCSESDGGKQTNQRDVEIIQQTADEPCPDGNCPDSECPDGQCPDGKCPDGQCPEKDGREAPSEDGATKNGEECPDKNCPKKGKKNRRRARFILPRGDCAESRKKPRHPKIPLNPGHGEDIILPDPPVEEVPQH